MTGVPDERWAQFGQALQDWREDVLGYKSRTAFARERLPLTEEGNVNTKLIQELENNYRPGTYTKWSLEDAEKAYGITHESVVAFLHGETDTLTRASAASAGESAPLSPLAHLGDAPIADRARREADAPYAMEIMEQLLALADSGVIDPSGEQVFPGDPGDAKAWDGIGGRLDVRDRVWFIADLRRRDDGRAGNSGTGAAGA